VALLAGVLAGCGGTGQAVAGHSDRPAIPAHAIYTVAAPVLHRGGAQTACNAILTSYPPAGCSGVAVAGYDFEHVAGVVHFPGVGWETPTLRLAGRWNGRTLVVTRVARAGAAQSAPGPPARCRVAPRPRGAALVRRIAHEHAEATLLAFGACGETAWVLVPVADHRTVHAIRNRYGGRIVVSGWLRPPRHRRGMP